MEYLCLRDCFVHDRFHFKGKTYKLPEGEDSKNFQPIEKPVEELNVSDNLEEYPLYEAEPKKSKKKKKS